MWEGGELDTPETIVVGKDDLDAYITKMHQYINKDLFGSHTPALHSLWAFFKVNNNQPMDLDHN